jgi:NAD(P)-dependent dehydrogenase (short-subunit alcohol dehydrogenase family)
MANVLITGSSSGLGLALAQSFCEQGDEVYGISRSQTPLPIKQITCDFNQLDTLKECLSELTQNISFDYVFLNAGLLGKIAVVSKLSHADFLSVFNVNVFANKVIIDDLLHNDSVKNIIGISSGAALKTYFGWSIYCTSKAAFKQLLSAYADENPSVHFLSLAPGIVKTKMQDHLYSLDANEIPSLEKFHSLYPSMETPDVVAKRIIKNLTTLDALPSGSFYDLREINS